MNTNTSVNEGSAALHCSSPLEIVKEFTAGYCAGIGNDPCRLRFREVDHWIAGWEAGRKDRVVKNSAIDAHLISIGLSPQNTVSVV